MKTSVPKNSDVEILTRIQPLGHLVAWWQEGWIPHDPTWPTTVFDRGPSGSKHLVCESKYPQFQKEGERGREGISVRLCHVGVLSHLSSLSLCLSGECPCYLAN